VIQPQSSRGATSPNDNLASWYTPGLVDGFGDRLLMFDNTETDSLELLRFYPSLTAMAGFEEALHERVRQVGRIPDHAFPLIVAVERLEGDGALALVSTHTPGKRLSAFFDKPGPRRGLNPAFVTGIITQVAHALSLLQSKGDDITHSAVTPDRIVVTTGGRICVVEHVLGLALRRLNLSVSQLWREFGLVSAPASSGALRLDARTDVYQLGVLAMEMLLGRRLTPLDLKDRIPDLLDQWSDAVTRAGLASDRLRYWLEGALQLRERSYATAAEAHVDLREVPSESVASAFDSLPGDVYTPGRRALQPAAHTVTDHPVLNAEAAEVPMASPPPSRPTLIAAESRWADSPLADVKPAAPAPIREAGVPIAATPPPVTPVAPSMAKHTPPPVVPRTPPPARGTTFKAPAVPPWIAATLGLIALIEAVVITALLLRQPSVAKVAEIPGSPIPATETAAPPTAEPPPVNFAGFAANNVEKAPQTPSPIDQAASRQRSGGVRLRAPFDLKVLLGEKVLGDTADGPIVAPAGTHQLELINTAFGYTARRPVTFRAGEMATVDIAIPPGRLSVNAQPWAEFFVDGKSFGETPLANLSVPVGEHEVVFRHPELGERRQTIIVRADRPTRVSASFDK
jgi:hypothetical protein